MQQEVLEGELVMARQERKKFLSAYDPIPYKVEEVKGSMTVASRGKKRLARNS